MFDQVFALLAWEDINERKGGKLKRCWKKCGSQSGPCEACGADRYCCKKGLAENGCDGKRGSKKGKCVPKPGIPNTYYLLHPEKDSSLVALVEVVF